MDLTSAIVGFTQAKAVSQVQFAVARKVLDQQKLQGSAAVQLIEAADQTASSGPMPSPWRPVDWAARSMRTAEAHLIQKY